MPWKKGESGNPAGRKPLRDCLTSLLRRDGEVVPDGGTKTRAELLSERVWELALKGERWAAELAYDRVDGRPAQRMNLNVYQDVTDEELLAELTGIAGTIEGAVSGVSAAGSDSSN
jgi:hypothetical protein